MSDIIHVLSDAVANQIAAGEVKVISTKTYAQSVRMMKNDLGSLGYKPKTIFKEPVSTLPKSSFERVFNQAVRTAKKQAKRDLTATEKANIRASIKQSKQSEIASI